jgi:hypothetical protein|tara:strand:- start:3932 stop:4180 length:249 start_codon:yes stop_codon:yes gene_type:complete|mmetsp:Transcript_13056/g.46939  ORF Transcript_13056/g.46939 Transcript_13056/m.46939 type:complete len:83 (+) Transcript_13056:1539-1787(+)
MPVSWSTAAPAARTARRAEDAARRAADLGRRAIRDVSREDLRDARAATRAVADMEIVWDAMVAVRVRSNDGEVFEGGTTNTA